MSYALIGRVVIWGGLAVAVGYGVVGAYIVIRLYFTYCDCGLLNNLGL